MDTYELDILREIFHRVKLERPIVILDVETTGLSVDADRIVELGAVKIRPDLQITAYLGRFNPGIPISPDATAVHGITDADVADLNPFAASADMLKASLTDVDLAGYNIRRFDVPILQAEFARTGRP